MAISALLIASEVLALKVHLHPPGPRPCKHDSDKKNDCKRKNIPGKAVRATDQWRDLQTALMFSELRIDVNSGSVVIEEMSGNDNNKLWLVEYDGNGTILKITRNFETTLGGQLYYQDNEMFKMGDSDREYLTKALEAFIAK